MSYLSHPVNPVNAFIFKQESSESGGPNLPEVVAAEDDSNDVFAYVVHVAFDGGQHDGALVRVLQSKPNR